MKVVVRRQFRVENQGSSGRAEYSYNLGMARGGELLDDYEVRSVSGEGESTVLVC